MSTGTERTFEIIGDTVRRGMPVTKGCFLLRSGDSVVTYMEGYGEQLQMTTATRLPGGLERRVITLARGEDSQIMPSSSSGLESVVNAGGRNRTETTDIRIHTIPSHSSEIAVNSFLQQMRETIGR